MLHFSTHNYVFTGNKINIIFTYLFIFPVSPAVVVCVYFLRNLVSVFVLVHKMKLTSKSSGDNVHFLDSKPTSLREVSPRGCLVLAPSCFSTLVMLQQCRTQCKSLIAESTKGGVHKQPSSRLWIPNLVTRTCTKALEVDGT